VSCRTSDGQTITQRYHAWGTIRPGPNNALPTDYTFTGQKLDESTGLMYYGARYYDGTLGRFVQADTIVPNPGNPQDFNRYAYVRNNPLKYTDPSGHAICVDEECAWIEHPVSGEIMQRRAGTPLPPPTWSWRQFLIDAFTFNIFGMGMTGEARPTVQMQRQVEASYQRGVAFTREHTPEPILAASDAVGQFLHENPEIKMGISAAMMTANTFAPPAGITNPVPERMARVVPVRFAESPTLGAPGAQEVFVTAADDIAGITTSRGLAERLMLVDEAGNLIEGPFAVFEFDVPTSGIASPVFRSSTGFVGGGLTGHGAREFVIPNLPLSALENLIITILSAKLHSTFTTICSG
jgi:RHS repeat-associated protein